MSKPDVERPYEKSHEENYEYLTVGELKEMLKDVPDDYRVSFDSACGSVHKRDFTLYHHKKSISIND